MSHPSHRFLSCALSSPQNSANFLFPLTHNHPQALAAVSELPPHYALRSQATPKPQLDTDGPVSCFFLQTALLPCSPLPLLPAIHVCLASPGWNSLHLVLCQGLHCFQFYTISCAFHRRGLQVPEYDPPPLGLPTSSVSKTHPSSLQALVSLFPLLPPFPHRPSPSHPDQVFWVLHLLHSSCDFSFHTECTQIQPSHCVGITLPTHHHCWALLWSLYIESHRHQPNSTLAQGHAADQQTPKGPFTSKRLATSRHVATAGVHSIVCLPSILILWSM